MTTYSMSGLLTIETLKWNFYLCLALRHANGKWNWFVREKFECSFDITKVGHIFDYHFKYKPIQQLDNHKIPLSKDIKGKIYNELCNS